MLRWPPVISGLQQEPLTEGTWNVRSLWRTGAARLLADQLSTVRINIMGLQEVCWNDSGELNIDNYTYSGPVPRLSHCDVVESPLLLTV